MTKKETKPAGLGKKATKAPSKKSTKKPGFKVELKSKPVAPTKAYKETEAPVLKGEAAEAVLTSKHKEFKVIDAIEVTGVSEKAPKLGTKTTKAAKAKLPEKPTTGALARAKAAIKAAATADASSKDESEEVKKPATEQKKEMDDGIFLQSIGRRPTATKAEVQKKASSGKMSFAEIKAQAAAPSTSQAGGFDVSKYLRK